jgi:hypothetical protein
MMRMQRVLQVDAGQDGEDVGLDGRHQHLEPVDRDDAEDRRDAGQAQAPAKPANTFRTAWPAIRLPARRMEWLTGRTKYEIISMIARIGRSANGAEETQKRLRNPAPFLMKPTTSR